MTGPPASALERQGMRAYEIRGGFGLDKLVACERPDPEPGPFQVRIRVKATSLNFRDLMMVRGQYNPRQPLPLVAQIDLQQEASKTWDHC